MEKLTERAFLTVFTNMTSMFIPFTRNDLYDFHNLGDITCDTFKTYMT